MSVALSLQTNVCLQESLKVEILSSVIQEIPFEWGGESSTLEEIIKLIGWASVVLKKPVSEWKKPEALTAERVSATLKEAFHLKIQQVATVHLGLSKASLLVEFTYMHAMQQLKIFTSGKGDVQLDKIKTLDTPELILEHLNSIEKGEKGKEEKENDEGFVIVNPKKSQISPNLKHLKEEITLLETWIKNPALISPPF